MGIVVVSFINDDGIAFDYVLRPRPLSGVRGGDVRCS